MKNATNTKPIACPMCTNFNAPSDDGFFRCTRVGCDAIYILEGTELSWSQRKFTDALRETISNVEEYKNEVREYIRKSESRPMVWGDYRPLWARIVTILTVAAAIVMILGAVWSWAREESPQHDAILDRLDGIASLLESLGIGDMDGLLDGEALQFFDTETQQINRELIYGSAEGGDVMAQVWLGILYYLGGMSIEGVQFDFERNHEEAVRWMSKAAEQGHVLAFMFIGDMYYFGHGTPQNYERALHWYTQFVQHADSFSPYVQGMYMNRIGVMYVEGLGTEQNFLYAAQWFYQAAKHGNTAALRTLEVPEIQGLIALHYWDNYLGHSVGSIFDTEDSDIWAEYWARKATEQGQWTGQLVLGSIYFIGGAGLPIDYIRATNLFRESAVHDVFGNSQFFLYLAYRFGHGVSSDYTRAEHYLREAAHLGHHTARESLAGFYRSGGLNIEPCEINAEYWLRRVAEQESP